MFLDEMEADSGCVSTYPFTSCPGQTFLLPFILAAYLLVTSIVLVNLLIAMFNDTYIKVQESSGQYWRMQNYELYNEYKLKPLLPAPLMVVYHAYQALRFVVRHVKRCCISPEQKEVMLIKKTNKESRLLSFQERMSKRVVFNVGGLALLDDGIPHPTPHPLAGTGSLLALIPFAVGRHAGVPHPSRRP